MAEVTLQNELVIHTNGDLPAVGAKLPEFSVLAAFAIGRFCAAEGIENVVTSSAFRSSFGEDFGVKLVDGPLAGLLARSVVVVNPEGEVVYTELVPETTNEPNYEAALAAIK